MASFDAVATDYDGTLAHNGVVAQGTLDALYRARTGGLRLLMITGRQVSDLLSTFAHPTLFDAIVAENGAVLYEPANESLRVVGSAPPPALLERLTQNSVRVSVGHSIVATDEAHAPKLLEVIRELGLDRQVIFNKGSAMAVPGEVSKGTGLAAVLATLHVAPERVVGIGDAENDPAFLRSCGLAVAVSNALPSVKAMADVVTNGAHGIGVTEVIDRLLAGDPAFDQPRHRSLGTRPGQG